MAQISPLSADAARQHRLDGDQLLWPELCVCLSMSFYLKLFPEQLPSASYPIKLFLNTTACFSIDATAARSTTSIYCYPLLS